MYCRGGGAHPPETRAGGWQEMSQMLTGHARAGFSMTSSCATRSEGSEPEMRSDLAAGLLP
jgi:hypothetical protein